MIAVATVSACLAASGTGAIAAATATPKWGLVPTPEVTAAQDNNLQGVSCRGTSFCMAVGADRSYNQADVYQTLTQKWTGKAWSVVPSPDTSASHDNTLAAVSCTSPTFCMAAGSYYTGTVEQTRIIRWNGTRWSSLPSPDASISQSNTLSAVSCTSTNFCMAAGWYVNGVAADQTIELKWDGAHWTLVPSPNSSPSRSNLLSGVSCTSATACMAVGQYDTGTAFQTLIQQWNGTKWTTDKSPVPSGAHASQLDQVSCSGTKFCMAVGYDKVAGISQTIAAKWIGAGWSLVSTPTPAATSAVLYTVGCTGARFCFALGGSGNQTVADQWNGTAWTASAAAGSSTAPESGISCTSSSACTAVGTSYVSSADRTQIARWNGARWIAVPSPNVPTMVDNYFRGVSCAGASFCMAVGEYGDTTSTLYQILTLKWTGSHWVRVGSPDSSTAQNNEMGAVSCTSATFCMAVGTYNTGIVLQTRIEKWNGSSWSAVGSPDFGTNVSNNLDSVSCTSASLCMAVGWYASGGVSQTLAEVWNGTRWALLSPVDQGTGLPNALTGVSCSGKKFCMAVGSYLTDGQHLNLAEVWNGIAWSLTSVPVPATSTVNYLDSVSCPSTTFCMAAGWAQGASAAQSLAETWKGPVTGWKIVSSADTSASQDNALNSVSCTSPAFCMAAGYGGASGQTMTQDWSGTGWKLVSSPNVAGTTRDYLNSVACASASFCMTTGQYQGSIAAQTFTEKW